MTFSVGSSGSKSIHKLKQIVCYTVLCAIISVGASAAFWAYLKNRGTGGGDDDNLYFYATGLALFNKLEYDRFLNKAIYSLARLRETPSSDEIVRLEIRRDYSANYALPSFVYYLTSRYYWRQYLREEPLKEATLPAVYAKSIVQGYINAFILVLVIFIVILIKIRSSAFLVATTLSISTMAYWATHIRQGYVDLAHQWYVSWDHFRLSLYWHFQNPDAYSLFAFSPRSNIAFLALGAFLLRWRFGLLPHYIMLFFMSFVHQSSATIVLAFSLAIDLIFFRSQLFDKKVASVAIAVVSLGLIRESLWQTVLGVEYAFIALVAGYLGLLYGSWVFIGLCIRREPLRQRTLVDTTTVAYRVRVDLIGLVAMWVVGLIITIMLYAYASPEQKDYFLASFSGRSLALIQPVLLTGMAYMAICYCTKLNRRVMNVAAGLVVLLTSAMAGQAFAAALHKEEALFAGFMQTFPTLEKVIDEPLPLDIEPGGYESHILWFTIRSLDEGVDHVSPAFNWSIVKEKELKRTSWPKDFQLVQIKSSLDGELQHAYVRRANGDEKRPLLISLHTWAGDYDQFSFSVAAQASSENLNYLHPQFRGPNDHRLACGSKYVIHDIDDAIRWALNNYNVDMQNIYLVGASGGAYTALMYLMYGEEKITHLQVWAPITDLEKWFVQTKTRNIGYYSQIADCVGVKSVLGASLETKALSDDIFWIAKSVHGDEGAATSAGSSVTLDVASARHRSPIYAEMDAERIRRIEDVSIRILQGIRDGQTGSVPVSHSIEMYNFLTKALGADKDSLVSEHEQLLLLRDLRVGDWKMGDLKTRNVVFSKSYQNVQLTLFDGDHEIIEDEVLPLLRREQRSIAIDQ